MEFNPRFSSCYFIGSPFDCVSFVLFDVCKEGCHGKLQISLVLGVMQWILRFVAGWLRVGRNNVTLATFTFGQMIMDVHLWKETF